MPFSLSIDAGLIRATLFGVLTGADMERFTAAMLELEAACATIPDRMVDLTGLEGIALGYDELAALAAQRRTGLTEPLRSALVASSAVQMGYARMYQTLVSDTLVTLRIFPTQEAALEWLSSG